MNDGAAVDMDADAIAVDMVGAETDGVAEMEAAPTATASATTIDFLKEMEAALAEGRELERERERVRELELERDENKENEDPNAAPATVSQAPAPPSFASRKNRMGLRLDLPRRYEPEPSRVLDTYPMTIPGQWCPLHRYHIYARKATLGDVLLARDMYQNKDVELKMVTPFMSDFTPPYNPNVRYPQELAVQNLLRMYSDPSINHVRPIDQWMFYEDTYYLVKNTTLGYVPAYALFARYRFHLNRAALSAILRGVAQCVKHALARNVLPVNVDLHSVYVNPETLHVSIDGWERALILAATDRQLYGVSHALSGAALPELETRNANACVMPERAMSWIFGTFAMSALTRVLRFENSDHVYQTAREQERRVVASGNQDFWNLVVSCLNERAPFERILEHDVLRKKEDEPATVDAPLPPVPDTPSPRSSCSEEREPTWVMSDAGDPAREYTRNARDVRDGIPCDMSSENTFG